MRLKQIKLAGFKSFVDPTTVTLPGNRCAVVGPNGCGKSNIIDAVRWVMGESSAKQLRGENLTDVIFNGSTARKPTSSASIELLFDNSDGRVGGEYAQYAELAIRREVTREAQSTYYLNGTKCRRRDIQDVFLGTGFGPRSYSIIEQGMINTLVEAKPEELRTYLEEAAGISKYKERRRETENRIRHTTDNLSRINDIREELARQLEKLQRQAKAAERYRELKEDERRVTAELYTLRYIILETDLKQHEERIADLTVQLEQANAEHRKMETAIEQLRAQHGDETEAYNQVQGRYYQFGAEIARIEEAIEFSTERVKQLELDLEGVNQRSAEAEQQLAMDESQIEELKNSLAESAPKVQSARIVDESAQQRLDELERAQREWQQQWDDFTGRSNSNARDAEVQASRIEHLEQLLQRLRSRAAELGTSLAQTQVPQDDLQVTELAGQIETMEREQRAVEADVDRCMKDLNAAREDVLMRERLLEEARGEVQSLRHELASIQAVQAAALGRDDRDAQEWLGRLQLADAPRLGESLNVAPGWELAVETVLGEFLNGIRVDSLDQFQQALSSQRDGDVALVEQAPVRDVQSQIALPELGSVVRSADSALGNLLYGVYAAPSESEALAVRRHLAPHESVITQSGVWIGRSWVRAQGQTDDAQSGVIQRGQEIDLLGSRVDEAELALGELKVRVNDGRERVARLEREREALQQKVQSLGADLGARRTDHGVQQVRLEEAATRRARLQQERADLERQIEQEQQTLKEARERLVHSEAQREALLDEKTQLTGGREQAEAELSKARTEAREKRDLFHAANGEHQATDSRLAASEAARARLIKQREDLASQQQSLKHGIESSATPLPELKENLAEKLAARLAEEEQVNAVRKKLDEIDQSVRAREQERGQAEEHVGLVRDALQQAQVEREGLSVQEGHLKEQIALTQHSLDDVRAALPEDAEEARWADDLARIERRIQRLGAINLAAIDEFETQSERKTYLDAQHEDLEAALETLRDAIRKIDRETRTRFKDTFETVNSRLGDLFPKVFGGGRAHLELTGEDLLDTGVSLMAQPPGKRNTSVHLLSGGEKAMTAVALIFAIFHLNPSPVCLLDEVDAPLDDANVTRFAELIKEMSADVQFVVITHNKLTMEMADYLMGVTMNEPGVSRLVSVDVEEAAAMAAV